jgi:hypothetical protein
VNLSSLQELQKTLEYIVKEPSMIKKGEELTKMKLNPLKTKECKISSERGHAHLSSIRALQMTL